MSDVTAIGELLIDFVPGGISDSGKELFEKNPGGAPANVLAMLAKLGKKTAFIGKVGCDPFGYFLEDTLKENNIETKGLVFSGKENTTLAFVHLKRDGERSFSFYRKPGADLMLASEEVDYDLISKSKLFHFGSVSMTADPSRTATLNAAEFARQQGVTVSFDPNLREMLWDSLEEAKKMILEGLRFTDILKVSEEELLFLAGTSDLDIGSRWIWSSFAIPLIFVTQGKKGCAYRLCDHFGQIPGYPVNSIDTTGAGDAFFGAVLYNILQNSMDIRKLAVEEIEASIRFANAAGALATTKKGAIPALPTHEQILSLMENGGM